MKKRIITAVIACVCTITSFASLSAGEFTIADTASFNIKSRTSFGMDIDKPYRFGLKQELTKFELKIDLAPYQKLSNRVNSSDAVGFIGFTFFDLELIFDKNNAKNNPNGGGSGYNDPVTVKTNRYQTGEFIAGIAKGNWIFQLNAGGNEPFMAPWNKGLQFVNDGIKFSWAYLDSMVDAVRSKPIAELKPQDCVIAQYTQDNANFSDRFAMNLQGAAVAAMYNREDLFGFNFKVATQYPYDSSNITESNMNGIAGGIDSVVTPTGLYGFKFLTSVAGAFNYGADENPDPVMAGTRIGYNIALNEDISLEPFIGLDIGVDLPNSGSVDKVSYESSIGATMHWPGQGGWLIDYFREDEGRVFPGMSVSYKINGDSTKSIKDCMHDMKITLFEPKGDEGLFYGLGAELILDIASIGKENFSTMLTMYLDYEIPGIFGTAGKLIPWTIICYDHLPYFQAAGSPQDGHQEAMKVDLGIKFDGVISNTVLGLVWQSGNIISGRNEVVKGFLKAVAEIKY